MRPADQLLIVVCSAGPEHDDFAHRIWRDLRDLSYTGATMDAANEADATLTVSWKDPGGPTGSGWRIVYNNGSQTFTLTSPEDVRKALYTDQILAHQKWLPPGRTRPFSEPIIE